MQEKELSISTVRTIRTSLVLGGTLLGYTTFFFANVVLIYSILVVATCMCVYGCYLWARLKGRHWGWMLFGLLAPAGFIALFLLKDKSHHEPPPLQP